MRTAFISLLLSILPIAILKLQAQSSAIDRSIIPIGLTFEYGMGSYAVTDEYISKEKYSGPISFYSIEWTSDHSNYIYHLNLNFRNSSKIKNYNVSTDIIQFSLNQGFNYAIPRFKLFDKDTYIYLGPSTEIFAYFNEQNIAVDGFDYAQSFALLISANLSSRLYYKILENFYIEGILNFSVLSLGARIVDSEEEDSSPAKILTLFAGTNFNLQVGPRYYFSNNLSLKLSYLHNFTRISAWEPLLSANDNILFTFTYGF